jgi:DNA mismatch repair protein MutS
VSNLTVAVAENADEVVFLHRIVPGAATKSYGIHVARIAGVPQTVILRAREVLAALERHGASQPAAVVSAAVAPVAQPTQLTLFGYLPSPVVERLKSLDVDNLTPRQALALVSDLQDLARKE